MGRFGLSLMAPAEEEEREDEYEEEEEEAEPDYHKGKRVDEEEEEERAYSEGEEERAESVEYDRERPEDHEEVEHEGEMRGEVHVQIQDDNEPSTPPPEEHQSMYLPRATPRVRGIRDALRPMVSTIKRFPTASRLGPQQLDASSAMVNLEDDTEFPSDQQQQIQQDPIKLFPVMHAPNAAPTTVVLPPPAKRVYTPEAPKVLPSIFGGIGGTSSPQKEDPAIHILRNPQALSVAAQRTPIAKSDVFSIAGALGYQHDLGLCMGRSFRVGFGPGSTLAFPTFSSQGGFSIVIRKVDFSAGTPDPSKPTPCVIKGADAANTSLFSSASYRRDSDKSPLNGHQETHREEDLKAILEVHLSNSVLTSAGGFAISEPESLMRGLEKVSRDQIHTSKEISPSYFDEKRHSWLVWSLVKALWTPTQPTQRRRASFDSWVREALIGTDKKSSEDDPLAEAITCLLQGQIAQASRALRRGKYYRLAAIVCQADGSKEIRDDAARHLAESTSPSPVGMQEIWTLLAGAVDAKSLTAATQGRVDQSEWLIWLGAILWFACDRCADVPDVVRALHLAITDGHVPQPFPHHLRENGKAADGSSAWDTLYTLLMSFSDKEFPLSQVLKPISHSDMPLDFSLAWLLMTTLRSAPSEAKWEISHNLGKQITAAFAEQLESCGMWEWAVYVYLASGTGLQQPETEAAVSAIISRNFTDADRIGGDSKVTFLLERLQVPQAHLHRAAAWFSKSSSDIWEEAAQLIKAADFVCAHDSIVNTLAPAAIAGGSSSDRREVMDMLQAIEQNASQVPAWSKKGSILLEFFNLCEAYDRGADVLIGDDPSATRTRIQAVANTVKEWDVALSAKEREFASKSSKSTVPDRRLLTKRVALSEISMALVGMMEAVQRALRPGDKQASARGHSLLQMKELPLPDDIRMLLGYDSAPALPN